MLLVQWNLRTFYNEIHCLKQGNLGLLALSSHVPLVPMHVSPSVIKIAILYWYNGTLGPTGGSVVGLHTAYLGTQMKLLGHHNHDCLPM